MRIHCYVFESKSGAGACSTISFKDSIVPTPDSLSESRVIESILPYLLLEMLLLDAFLGRVEESNLELLVTLNDNFLGVDPGVVISIGPSATEVVRNQTFLRIGVISPKLK